MKKGIILAGGHGTRLEPLTLMTNKHLLPVYDKQMIMYPLQTLLNAGIDDILIISGREHAGHFLELLGSGSQFNAHFTYKVQDEAGGIAQALLLAKDFIRDGERFVVILGDNIFENTPNLELNEGKLAKVFLKVVPDAFRFGVAERDYFGELTSIVEKPKGRLEGLAVTGLYVYSSNVFSFIDNLKPSARGELEITDVNNFYVGNGKLGYEIIDGFWSDAGTFESLMKSSIWASKK